MSQNSDLNAKLDKILEKIESLENKMDSRMNKLEDQYAVLMKKSNKHDKIQKSVLNEVTNLKARVNSMEQNMLINNIIIRGVKELESNEDDLGIMVDLMMCKLEKDFESSEVLSSHRIGVKKTDKPRLILVKMTNVDSKTKIMKNLKDKSLDCSQFTSKNKAWGTKNDRIFLGDHLTSTTNNIFYHARQLKKRNKVKYAWSKLGKIYVKKDDDSRAVQIKCQDQLSQFDKQLYSDEESSCSESETEAEIVIDSKKRPKRKLDRTHSDPILHTKRSPRPKRTK